ncbi:MAG TPA: hypothetical protein GXX28_04535 [Firmicutes bacterium]|nr:hypothetical protein [Bacillota bacterium]
MMPVGGGPGKDSPPRFLQDRTAVLLSAAPGLGLRGGPTEAAGRAEELTESARRLWQELLRRLDGGELRLYAEELAETLGLSVPALGGAFLALRRARLAEWDEPGPYLYLRRPETDGAPDQTDLARVYRALEEATGRPVNPLELPRLQEWVAVLGLQDVLDEIALCRERGPCRFSRLSFALDKACSRRRRISAFGPLHGLGVLPGEAGTGTETDGTGVPAPAAVANVAAYDPVPPETVRRWMAAHPDLYDDLPPAPPPKVGGEGPNGGERRSAAWATAYDPVPRQVVRRWAEAFSADYAVYRQEYRLLSEKAEGGPFRRRGTRR